MFQKAFWDSMRKSFGIEGLVSCYKRFDVDLDQGSCSMEMQIFVFKMWFVIKQYWYYLIVYRSEGFRYYFGYIEQNSSYMVLKFEKYCYRGSSRNNQNMSVEEKRREKIDF